jgi:hypothetical protein
MKIVVFNKKELEVLNQMVQDELYATEKGVRDSIGDTDARVNSKKLSLVNILKKI